MLFATIRRLDETEPRGSIARFWRAGFCLPFPVVFPVSARALVLDTSRRADCRQPFHNNWGIEMPDSARHFPFTAIVGQEFLKTVYLANVVDPSIGGLLISGPKGTGKSTIVHAIAGLLPEYQAVADCVFHCNPERPDRFCSLCRATIAASSEGPAKAARKSHDGDERVFDRATSAADRAGPDPTLPRSTVRGTVSHPMRVLSLPLSCTEDRLIGSIDIEALLNSGERRVQPGILGQANRNLLYVDEVNLLPDHLVDDILDAAASHWNRIEREGVSVSHPCEFILVGTMNPEEGELRPQILDRFPLSARVETIREPEARVEIVKRNLAFERDPGGVYARFASAETELRNAVVRARDLLREVELGDSMLFAIAEACSELKVDGQRPDIVIAKASRAMAALHARLQVDASDVLLAAEAALHHRTRDGGLLDPPSQQEIRTAFQKALNGRSAGGKDSVGRESSGKDSLGKGTPGKESRGQESLAKDKIGNSDGKDSDDKDSLGKDSLRQGALAKDALGKNSHKDSVAGDESDASAARSGDTDSSGLTKDRRAEKKVPR